MKKTMKRILAALLCAVMLLGALTMVAVAENLGDEPRVSFMYGEQEISSVVTATAGTAYAPAVPASSKGFAWIGTLNGESKLLFEGDVLELSAGDVGEFRPALLNMTTEPYAELRLNQGSTGMRYRTHVSLEDYESLTELGVTISFGTLIVPRNYVKNIGGTLTHAALDAGNKKRVDVAYDIANGWYAETDETGTFVGSVDKMKLNNYGLYYTARGYAKLTFENGSEKYVYADNNGVYKNSVLYQLAFNAYNDRSYAKDDTYCYSVTDGSFSPYTAFERQEMRSILDSVVALKYDRNSESGFALADNGAFYVQSQHKLTLIKEDEREWMTYFSQLEDKEATAVLVIERSDKRDFEAGQYTVVYNGTKFASILYDGKILISLYLEYTGTA